MAIAGFNETYYLQTNKDVLTASLQGKITAEEHFLKYGANELRNPNANFDMAYYAAANPDVVAAVKSGAFANVYDHYLKFGGKEGRVPSAALANFNGAAYLAANADLATAGYTAANVLAHYVLYGAAEGRSGGTAQQVTGNYVGTTADDTVTPAGGQASTVRVEGGQQGVKGDTLVVTSGSAASFQFMDLSNNADQNQTRDNSTGNNTGNKIGPVVQGFENIDATAATINMNLTALDRTSITNTGSANAAQSGSILQGGTGRDTLTGGNGNDSLVGNDGNDVITGGAGADSIYGGVGNDTIDGGTGNDLIEDGAGDDVVTGGAGNDTITVGAGTNSIDGGADNDTITLVADQATSTTVSTILGGDGNDIVVLNGTAITAASRVSVSGGAGNDTITAGLGVETINAGAGNDTVKFTAANLGATDVFNGNDGQDFLQLEIPTGSGTNTYVLTPVNGQFAGFEGIELIDSSANTNAKQYKIVLTDNFVANNLVNGSFLIDARGLPGGSNLVIDFSQLTSASAARFAANAFRVLASPSTDVRDQNNNTITNTYLVNATNAALSATAAFSVFAGDTTVTAGSRNADGTINTNGQAAYTTTGGTAETGTGGTGTNYSNTVSLTINADNLVGTSGNDRIDGSRAVTGGQIVNTLNNSDRIDGGAGTNILYAQLQEAVDVTPTSIVNVQTIDIENSSGGARTLNLVNADSKLTSVRIANSTQNTTVSNVMAALSTVELENLTGTSLVSFGGGLTGTSDALALKVTGVTGGANVTIGNTGGSGYETINLESAGSISNNITLSDGNSTSWATLNVTGSRALTVAISDTSVTTVNAANFTGALTATVAAGNTQAMTITGGSGNDVINMNSTYTSADVINGGAGTDRLTLTNAEAIGATSTQTNVTNVEVIGLSDGLNGTVSVNNFNATGLRFGAATAGASTIGYAAGTNSLDLQTFAVGHAVTVNVAGTNLTDILNLTAGSSAAGVTNTAGLTFNGAETINLTSQGGANTFTTFTMTDDAATQALVITGDQTITFSGAVRADSINASGMTGSAGLVLTVGGNTGTTTMAITGTANADTLTGGYANDIIVGGAGNDRIAGAISASGNTAAAGAKQADVFTGGAGADTFVFSGSSLINFAAVSSGTTAITRITDFVAGTDKFALINTGAAFNAVTVNTAQTIATAADLTAVYAGITALGAASTTTAQVAVITVSAGAAAGTYLYVNDGAAVGVSNTDDMLINITGVTGTISASDFVFA